MRLIDVTKKRGLKKNLCTTKMSRLIIDGRVWLVKVRQVLFILRGRRKCRTTLETGSKDLVKLRSGGRGLNEDVTRGGIE